MAQLGLIATESAVLAIAGASADVVAASRLGIGFGRLGYVGFAFLSYVRT